MIEQEFKELLFWLHDQKSNIKYGEISVTCIIHAGNLKRTIKTISVSELKG